MELYERCQPRTPIPGMSLLPKLKFEHVNLTNFSKMRVDLAAQVFCVCVYVCVCEWGWGGGAQMHRRRKMF